MPRGLPPVLAGLTALMKKVFVLDGAKIICISRNRDIMLNYAPCTKSKKTKE